MRIRVVAPEQLRHEWVGKDARTFEALDEPRTPNIGHLLPCLQQQPGRSLERHSRVESCRSGPPIRLDEAHAPMLRLVTSGILDGPWICSPTSIESPRAASASKTRDAAVSVSAISGSHVIHPAICAAIRFGHVSSE